MAGQGVELATAWVRLVPSMEGATDSITKALAPGTEAAAAEGEKAGHAWSAKAKVAMAAGAALAVAGTVAAFKGLYDIGSTFDDVTDTIRADTGLQGEALQGLVDVAKNVGSTVPAEFDAVGTTVADLNTRLGLTGDTLETVASQYLEAGRILGSDVDIASTSAAFSAFKIEGDAVVGAMDDLFRVSQATGVGMNELAAGVQAQAPALQAMGFGFQDSISLLGSLDKAGMNSTAVMASMTKGIVTLAKDGEQPADAFKRVTGELQGFIDSGDKAAALDLASTVFGTKGAAQMVAALESGVIGMNDLMGATGATGDTILGVGEETMDFAEKWQVTLNTAMTAIEPLATSVFTAIGDGLTAAMPTLEALGAWVSENTWSIGVLAGVIGVGLMAAFAALVAPVVASTVALLANPITWIVIAVMGLIAAIVALVMNWDAAVAWITDIWGGFIGWITGVIDGFVIWWNELWTAVGQTITGIWGGFIGTITDLWNGFTGWLKEMGDGIATWWSGLWEGIGDTIQNVADTFGTVFEKIRGVIVGAFDGIVVLIKTPINAIIGLVNTIIDALNTISIDIPDWVPTWGGQKFGISIPKIPQLADGATVLPRSGGTLAVLAEAGKPESVVDTGLMNKALEQGLSGRGGGSDRPINIYIQGVNKDPHVLANEIFGVLRSELS